MTGLLGMNPYPGLLQPEDLRYAQTQGLLGAGAGLLGASGWSPTPISTGQALGAGLQQGLGAYNQAANQAMQGKLMQQKLNQQDAPYSTIGKLQADLTAGRITPEQYQQALEVMMKPGVSTTVQNYVGGPATRTLSPEEAEGIGLPPGTVAQEDPKGKLSVVNKPSEQQQAVVGYLQGAEAARQEAEAIEGWTPEGVAAAGNPLTRYGGGLIGLVSDADKKAYDAMLAWTWNILRAESGATVTKDEAKGTMGIYWPQPGDTAEVLELKKRLRAQKESSLRTRANRPAAQTPAPPPGFILEQ